MVTRAERSVKDLSTGANEYIQPYNINFSNVVIRL